MSKKNRNNQVKDMIEKAELKNNEAKELNELNEIKEEANDELVKLNVKQKFNIKEGMKNFWKKVKNFQWKGFLLGALVSALGGILAIFVAGKKKNDDVDDEPYQDWGNVVDTVLPEQQEDK